MTKFFLVLLLGLSVQGLVFAETYEVNPELSEVKWHASKVTGKHDGKVKLASGSIEVESGQLLGGEAVIDMTSISVDDIKDETNNQKLTGHLKSADFFDVENHPTAAIRVTDARPTDHPTTFDVTADLTVKGITQPVNFQASVVELAEGVKAEAKIPVDRTLFDVRYGSGKFVENLGDRMIHDIFELHVSVTADNTETTASF